MPAKRDWIEKALYTFKFHRSKLLIHDKWTTEQTANSLNRAFGSVSEDLLIARWLRTHEKELKQFEYAKEALKYIRAEEKKRKIGLDDA